MSDFVLGLACSHLPSTQHPLFLWTYAPLIPGLNNEIAVEASKTTTPESCAPSPRNFWRAFLPSHLVLLGGGVELLESFVCARNFEVNDWTNWNPSRFFVRKSCRDAREFFVCRKNCGDKCENNQNMALVKQYLLLLLMCRCWFPLPLVPKSFIFASHFCKLQNWRAELWFSPTCRQTACRSSSLLGGADFPIATAYFFFHHSVRHNNLLAVSSDNLGLGMSNHFNANTTKIKLTNKPLSFVDRVPQHDSPLSNLPRISHGNCGCMSKQCDPKCSLRLSWQHLNQERVDPCTQRFCPIFWQGIWFSPMQNHSQDHQLNPNINTHRNTMPARHISFFLQAW